jgi:hypothetical protein
MNATDMTRLEELLAERDRIKAEFEAAPERLDEADKAVLEERFAGWERYAVGDIVLVPRKLFGKTVMWPAQVACVHLRYTVSWWPESYEPDPGGMDEHQSISYTVYLRQADGTFGGSSQGFYHKEIAPAPEEQQ